MSAYEVFKENKTIIRDLTENLTCPYYHEVKFWQK